MSRLKDELTQKIDEREARVAVIGLGYVGLPLALDFAAAGFPVVGIDIDEARIGELRQGRCGLAGIPESRFRDVAQTRLKFVSDYEAVEGCDAVIICVPTPLNKTRDPDVRYLMEAAGAISGRVHPGMLISLESTTYPGTTSDLLCPQLEENGLKAGRDFFLVFSPERIDLGRDLALADIPKVIGGFSSGCLEVGRRLYQSIIKTLVPVSSTQAAEMVKLLENTFRAVNIALVNEVAIMCDKLGLDVWEVIDAAATKPYGFMRFTPGPGVGGHCIPLDPHYLSWKMKTLNYNARFVQLAGEINSQMPQYWAGKVQDALNEAGRAVKDSRILVVGVAYKPDVDDVRESPALDILEILHLKGADVRYYDPFVPTLSHHGVDFRSEPELAPAIDSAHCVVVVTNHSTIDWKAVGRQARLLVDTRNASRAPTSDE